VLYFSVVLCRVRHTRTQSRIGLHLQVHYTVVCPSVSLSVCNVGGLWSHSATNSGNRHMTEWVGVSASCPPKPIEPFYDPKLNWRNPVRYGKCGVLHFGAVRRLACRAISASAELLVVIIHHSSGPGSANGPLCMSCCVRTINFEQVKLPMTQIFGMVVSTWRNLKSKPITRCAVASVVLTANGLVNGNPPLSTLPTESTSLNRSPKIVTGDFAHDFYCCAKFDGNYSMEASRQIAER